MSPDLVAGVDVGGTKVAVGFVDTDGRIITEGRRETPGGDADALARVIAELIHDLDGSPAAVGLGLAGWIDRQGARVQYAPNLTWRDVDIRAVVREATGLPTVVENDANAAAWGEVAFGAARGETEVVALTVGTGLGGGLVLGGELQRGGFGIAGEPGHMRVVPGGRECPCGRLGCWEQYASGTALVREAAEIAAADPSRATLLLELCGGEPLSGPHVTAAARGGDPAALEALEIVGRWLGSGLASVVSLLDPAVVVVGGGAGDAGELLLAPARATFEAELPGAGHRPLARIIAAELGNSAGMVGAAALARHVLG